MAANKKCAWWNEMLFKLLVGFTALCSGDIICLVERCEHHHHNHQKYALWMHDSDKEGSRIQQFKAMNLLQSVFYETILTLATKILCCNYNGLMSMYVHIVLCAVRFGHFWTLCFLVSIKIGCCAYDAFMCDFAIVNTNAYDRIRLIYSKDKHSFCVRVEFSRLPIN